MNGNQSKRIYNFVLVASSVYFTGNEMQVGEKEEKDENKNVITKKAAVQMRKIFYLVPVGNLL